EYSRKLQNDEGLRAGFSVEIGEGSVDWSRVRDELAKIGYTGWATAEVKGGDRKRLQDISTRMNKVLDL
ncbi:MAG: sugar phosphate isomerase/epimerase, partial [Pirellulaceae bacterium]|nr:sugar phosphate isomerase/epimerase [Pirellulaceae bacterium]